MPHQRIEQYLPLRAIRRFLDNSNRRLTPQLGRQISQLDRVPAAHRTGIAQHVAQLPHVARPAITQQALQRRSGQAETHAAAGGFFVEDAVDQRQFVAALA
ncbi:hypothetical protein D9M71_434330 [compost metagenome]